MKYKNLLLCFKKALLSTTGRSFFYTTASLLAVSGCGEKEVPEDASKLARSVKVIEVKTSNNTIFRTYPTKIESSKKAVLAFEISGKLEEFDLEVGQRVSKGEFLLKLDPSTIEIAIDQANAQLRQAKAVLAKAKDNLARQNSLLRKKIISVAAVTRARNSVEEAKAQVQQVLKQVAIQKDNLTKTKLISPLDAVIDSISVEPFATIAAGQQVLALHNDNEFEAKFEVTYEIAKLLSVGMKVKIHVGSDTTVNGVITELGTSANNVSTFPVVVKLEKENKSFKQGTVAEVELQVMVNKNTSYVLPLSALIVEGESQFVGKNEEEMKAMVYVYDKKNHTVKKREVYLVGIKKNKLLISRGLKKGDVVVTSGVAFIKAGQKVKPLYNGVEK